MKLLDQRWNRFFSSKKNRREKSISKDIFEDKGESFHYFEKVKLHTLEEIKRSVELVLKR